MTFTELAIRLPPDNTDRGYPILIGTPLLTGEVLRPYVQGKQVLIVTNEVVAPLYLSTLKSALVDKYVSEVVLPDGEGTKTIATLQRVLDALVTSRMNRDATIVALGGGVVGDMAGFAAAIYQRGINFVQVPTTLLAQVDSSVGGKTAVNHPGGKNLVGAFYQPRAVIADVGVLNTLPSRELSAGLAEVIKYGVITDVAFFNWLEQQSSALLSRDVAALTQAIRRSCEIKANIVGQDEREQGIRAILNYGHTFGHAVENAMGYGEWLHGEAVAVGMIVAANMSHRLGWLDAQALARVIGVVAKLGLPTESPKIGARRALDLMGMDKKVLAGRLRLVLLRSLGHAVVTSDYDEQILTATLSEAFGAA